jgi:hypothetical protein
VCFRMFVCDSELRLGYMPSSFEKEFLSAPIHSPLSGSSFRSFRGRRGPPSTDAGGGANGLLEVKKW